MVETLEKELITLESKRVEAQRNFNDTGNDRYFKIVSKCENQISEIEKLLNCNKKAALQEFELIELVTDIKIKVKNLRLDYPHEDGLLLLSNYLESRVEKWIRQ
jgi:hypothetical protein